MKQGKPLITFVMVVFALVLCIYFGFYVFDTFNDPYSTTHTYQYTHSESTQANGVLIRAEQVLNAQGGIVELQCGEGEKVGVRQTVAYVYQDSQAQKDSAALEALAAEISVLESVLTSGAGVDSAAQMDENVLQAVVELRAGVARQDFSELDELVHDVKSHVIQRGLTYGEGVTAAELKARLSQLRADYKSQSSSFAGSYSKVTAKNSGTFSALVDGLEDVLTPEGARSLTPSALESILDAGAGHVDAVGKLITDNRWYFAANLPEEVAEQFKPGSAALLRFSGDFDQDVEMRVEHISQPEGERVTVLFSTDRYLGQTTLLRFQSAELIFNSYSGLRIPKQALHMEKYTTTDEQTGQVTEHQMLGVYILIAGKAEFKQVRVVTESDEFYVVESVSTAAADALRAGDEVIVRAVGLYDGKLMDI